MDIPPWLTLALIAAFFLVSGGVVAFEIGRQWHARITRRRRK